MDVVLNSTDHYFLTPYIYPESWKEDDPYRQVLSLLIVLIVGGYVMYFGASSFSYFFLFDQTLMKHPHFLKDQVKLEIICTAKTVPVLSVLQVVPFFLEVRGYSKMYENVQNTRFGYYDIPMSIVIFILFTDLCIYWIHRVLHHRWLYKRLHKPHHKWIIPTPFASHAFHPIDAFLQSCPYHVYPFLFPMHKYTFLGLFVFINFWTVSIHDGNYKVPNTLKPVINGSAHHTDHHIYFNCNYGQFFTLWDRMGGSFRDPSSFNDYGPADDVKKLMMEDTVKNKKE